jgi:hypothetical protein
MSKVANEEMLAFSLAKNVIQARISKGTLVGQAFQPADPLSAGPAA